MPSFNYCVTIQLSNFFPSLVPLPVTGINEINETHRMNDVSVSFTWEKAVGTGPEYVISSYRITITPPTVDGNSSFEVGLDNGLLITLSLTYNVEHTLNFFAINCAGMSQPTSIYYGKLRAAWLKEWSISPAHYKAALLFQVPTKSSSSNKY